LALSFSSRFPISELKAFVVAEEAKMAERAQLDYTELASGDPRDITNLVQRGLAERLAWMAEELRRREDLNRSIVALRRT
jgi:hypothetical protein